MDGGRSRSAGRGVGNKANGARSGYAAVDAMIALAILSTTIVLSLTAIRTAHGAASIVVETRQARQELQYLLDNAPRAFGVQGGRAGGFDWRLATQSGTDVSPSGAQICDRAAQVRSLSSGRRYGLATSEICPPAQPTP
jgi:hypothetical protein